MQCATLAALLSTLALAACGGVSQPQLEFAGRDSASLPEFARNLFDALRMGAPSQVALSRAELEGLPQEEALAAAIDHSRWPAPHPLLRNAIATRICVQSGPELVELPAGTWSFRRVLLSLSIAGRPYGLWIDGWFVQTNRGLRVAVLERVEDPRWSHSDLELAVCDVGVELETPQDVVVVTP